MNHKYLFTAALIALTSAFAAFAAPKDRVELYLIGNGVSQDQVDQLFRERKIQFYKPRGEAVRIAVWDVPGVSQPNLAALPDAAPGEVDRLEEARRQDAKPGRQKQYENKVFAALDAEGVTTTNDVKLTQALLDAAYDAWDLLPGNQGDTKAAKFERLMRPLRARGETEFTIRRHP